MDIVSVATKLEEFNLAPPALNVLTPCVDNYTALLFQPDGSIDVDAAGVRNRDQGIVAGQFSGLLALGCQEDSDLVITPEYALPWPVLIESLNSGITPSPKKLWALGCESIRYSELESIRNELTDGIQLIYEPLQGNDEQFLSPLAYIFRASLLNSNEERVVILVQFKTHPMGDVDHFEINGLQRGLSIYRFGAGANEISLTSLICADVFAFEDSHAQEIYDRGLILHIQLNPDSRHEAFRDARGRLLRYAGDETEIICLNWASDVRMRIDGAEFKWENDAASAWYIKSTQCESRDAALISNHKRGFYYTRYEKYRSHALFLNFEPSVFQFEATKVWHLNVQGAVSRRRGPQLTRRYSWRGETVEWENAPEANSGFGDIAHECGDAEAQLASVATYNPVAAERLLALSAGEIKNDDEWYKVDFIDSFRLGPAETINRITFCQDRKESAKEFRITRLKRLAHLWSVIVTGGLLPAPLSDIDGASHLNWNSSAPHQNVEASAGRKATIIYLGENTPSKKIEDVHAIVDERLRRFFSNAQEARLARQRLVVLNRNHSGEIVAFGQHAHIGIADTGQSSIDIDREA